MRKRHEFPPERVTASALAAADRTSRAKAVDYREAILILLLKNFSQDRIAEFLRGEGVKISQSAISTYLQKHPPTDAEVARLRQKLAEQDGAKTSDAERHQKREKFVARVREERRTELEKDDTDYSFLDVQGRPFRIRPKE